MLRARWLFSFFWKEFILIAFFRQSLRWPIKTWVMVGQGGKVPCTVVLTQLGKEITVSKVLVLLTCCWIKPNAHVLFRVRRSNSQKAGPLGAGELPQQCPMWVDHTGGTSLRGGAQVGLWRCDWIRLSFTFYYAWPKTNSESKVRCPRYSGSDGSYGK